MKKALIILAIVLGSLVLLVGGCVALVGGAANQIDQEMSKERALTYRVTSTGDGSVHYTAGQTSAMEDFSGEWSKEITTTGWDLTWVTATGSMDGGTVTCSILDGDKVIVEQSATGQFASASCHPPTE